VSGGRSGALRVVVGGGGIGGLTAALALRRAGLDAQAPSGRVSTKPRAVHYWRQAVYDAAGLAELRGDELGTALRLATGRREPAAPGGRRGDR
jgi:hypothetical protein